MRLTVIPRLIRAPLLRALPGALLAGWLLTGCSTPHQGGVQVVDRNGRPAVTNGYHTVRRGDTLSSIATRYGWDWRALASANGIAPPYVIHPGQRIRFDRGARNTSAASQPQRVTPVAPTAVVSRPAPPATVTTTAAPQPPVSKAPAAPAPPITITPVSRSASGWAWPANGQIIGRFSSNGSLNKGIDIAGELGQPVLAASDGAVVYAGSGLRGYGELVIIKHNDTYVSAYGHNRRLLVREGQRVKAGQSIAEMGSTGTDRVKLHFEIRRQGKPVDPLQYLPRR